MHDVKCNMLWAFSLYLHFERDREMVFLKLTKKVKWSCRKVKTE